LAHNFCPFFTKKIFLQRQIHSPEPYLGGILIFFPKKKLGLIEEKKISAKKLGSPISKLGTQGIKQTPLKIKF
jgi:hypothetical protein